jgi:LysM repeat protein
MGFALLLGGHFVSTANPFRIPPCLERADLQMRRQKRFQKIVVLTVAAVAALLVVLLIEGCVGEHAKASAAAPAAESQPKKTSASAAVESKPISALPPAPAPAASPLKMSAPSTVSAPETVYVVKAGDTLTRIAKQHQTTVKAIKAVNGLNRDTIGVGMKLKLPTA